MVNIDERVMSMKFDNSQFRRAAAETIGDLGRLRKSVKMDGVTSGLTKLSDPVKDLDKTIKSSNIKGGFKGISTAATQSFSEIESSASGVKLDGITAGVENAKRSFLSLGDIASVALGGLAAKGIDKALGGLKGLYDNTLGQIKTGGMSRARNLEQANFMLGGIMESEAQVQQVMDAANASVTGTAYGLDQAAKAAAQFAASGVPIEKLETSLTGIVGVAAMTSSEFDDISRIFTTVAGNGRVFATELNSIGARGINAAAALAEHFGVTEERVREMVSAGEVNFEEFSTAMATAFGPQAAKANDTYSGSLSNLRSALSRIGADTAAVKLEGMRDVFNALRPIINGVHNALKPFIGLLNNNLRVAFAGVVGPLTKAGDAFTAFFDKDQGPAFAGSFRPVIEFIQDIGQVAGLVSEVLKDMVAVIFGASPRFIEMSETTTKAGTTIQHIFRKLLSVIMLVPEIIGMIIKAFRGTEDSAGSAGLSILELVDKVSGFLYITAEVIRKSKALNVIVGVIGGLFRIAAGGVAVFLKAISLVVDGIVKLRNPLDVLKDIVEYAKNHFAGIFDSLRTESLDKFIDFVVSGFRRIKKAIRNFSFGSLLKDFKIPRVSFKAFESVSKIFDNVRKSISRVVKSLKEIDWSPITSMFSGGFTMPSFGDIKNIGSGISSSIMGGINNLSWDYVLEFAVVVRESFVNLIEYLRGIDWGGIWTNIRSSFVTGVRNVVGAMSNFKDLVIKAGKSVAEGLKTFGSWAVEALGNVDWASVGSAIGNGIVKAIAFIAGSAAAITGAIANFFKSAIDAIDWDSVLEGLSKMVENIEGAFKEIGKAFRGETIDTSYLENALGKSTADLTISVSQDLGAKTKSLREGIRDFFGVLFGTGPDVPAEASELMKGTKDFGDNVKTISASLKSPFGTAKKSVMSEITGFGSTIQKAAESLLEGVNIIEILNGIGIAFTGAGIFKLVGVLEQFAAVPKSLAGALDSIGTSIKSMGEAAKIEAQGNSYLKLAIAFGILAGSVWVLSQVPWDQLNVGLAVVLTLIVTLVGSAILLDKMLSEDAAAKLNELGNAFLKIGLSIGIMAASVWLLGQMDPETIIQGLFTAILSIAALAGGVALAGLTKGLNGMGFAFMGLAAGVAILAGAFLLFKMISYEDIEKGLVTMGAAVLAISLAARIADGKKLAGAGMAMIGVGAGLYALAFSFKAIADLDDRQLLIGLGVLTAVLIGIAAVTHFGGKNLVTTAGTLVGISFALMALAYAMSLIAAIPFWDLVGGMAVLIGGLAGLGWALKKFPPTLPAIAGSLAGIAGALAILVVAIYILGSMDLGVLVQGALAIGFLTLAIGGLAFAVSKMPPNSLANIFGLTVAFMALAGSVLVMAHAMRMFQDIEWDSLGKAGAVVAGAVAAFAVLAAIGKFLGAGLAIFGGGLAAVGGGLLVIAGAVWVFADAVGKIADSMKTLSEIGDSIKDALKNAGTGITLFAEEAEEGLRKLFGVIGFTGGGKVKSLAKLFESFGEIPSDIGNRLAGLKKGLSELQEVIPTIESLAEIGGPNGNGNAKFLNQFFKAFSEIEPNVGEGITSLVDGIRDLSGIHNELAILKTFMDDLAGGDRTLFNKSRSITDLKHFFEAFDDIDVNVGESVSSLSEGIAALGGVKDQLNTLKTFADGFWGDEEERTVFNNSRSIKDLKHFFEAFEDIDSNVGESVSNLADGIGALGGVKDQLNTLKTFADGFWGDEEERTFLLKSRSITDLKHFFEAFEGIDSNVGESVSNLADGIGALGGVKDQLNTLKEFADGFWGEEETRTLLLKSRSITDLKHFFEAFSVIPPDIGSNVSSLADGISALGKVSKAMKTLKEFGGEHGAQGWWDNLLGRFDSAEYLKDFFDSFGDIPPDIGPNLSSLAEGITALDGVKTNMSNLASFEMGEVGNFAQVFKDLSQHIDSDLGEKLVNVSSGIRQLDKAVPKLIDIDSAMKDLDTSALGTALTEVGDALKSGAINGISEAADVISSAVDSILEAVTGRSSDFKTAGEELTSAIAEGISNTREMVETTAEEVANAAAEATLIARDAMYDSGLYIIAGLAAGIRDGSEDAVTAARETADAVAAISREALDINSPSRVFMEIGESVGQGLAIGIDSRQNEVIQAGYNIALAGIKGFEEANPDVVNAGTAFVSSLVKGMENSPFNQRLRQLSTHAKAAHATAVKERKIEDQEEQERAEEERKNIYKEVEEAQKALAEAKEDLSNSEADVKESKAKAKQGEEDKKQTAAQATKAARDAQREKDKITDAEERYQKALREREKYEYRMHGEEAGVAFVDGVAVGLMDDKEAIPSVAEILAQLLLEEVDTLKSKVGNYADVFDGLATISNTSKNMSDNVRDFTRALKRLNNATSSRSIQRNMGMLFDSTVGFMGGIQDLIGVLNIFEPFLPSLLQSFEHSLPAIAGMVAPFAPELASTLGGGLAAAVPAILGPAGGIIAAVAGIGIFLWDQANNKTILKAFKSIFAGVGGFLSKLPEMIVGGLMTLLKGVKETLNDLPGLVDFILTTFIDTVSALLEGIPEMIPLLIEGIIEAILWVLVNAPGILLEVGVALINGMAKAIDAAIKGLANVILMPFRWLTGEIGGTLDLVEVMSSAVDRMAKASGNIIRAALNLILTPFASIYNAIGGVFGLEQIGRDSVIGFAEAIVGAMRKVIDFIAFPFIGLWNFIAGLFGWRQLAGDAASEFIFGTKKALDDGASEVASAAERMAKLMDKHVKGATRDTLADVKALIDEQVALIKAGATDGVLLGGEAAREVTDRVWSNIEDVFDMYGLGKGELEALKNAFYQGTTNPETMVSSFNNVFDHIQRILTLNKVGEGAVDSLNQSMIDSIKQGMMDESMGEFNNRGYQTGTEYVQGMISGLGATKSEIKAASKMVWDDVATVFDFYGLGDEGLEDLKRSYMSGTQNPETYAQTFEKVFSEIERKLLLADIGTESVEALRTSMVESVDYVLQPSVRDSFGGVNREIENALSSEGGQRIGEGIVQGIFSGIKNAIGSLWDFLTSPFVNLYETIRSILSDGYSIASSLVHGIVDGFWSFGNTFSNVGRDIIQGITSGVSSKAGQLFDNLVSTVTDPIGAIKRLLNIHSPSRVMMEIGRNIGDGLTIGIERSTDGVADSMEAAGGDILSAARRMLLEVNDLLEDEVDPVITPILDLSLLKDGVDNMMGMMPNEGLNLETAMLNTTNIASLLSGVAGEAREANNITNIEFHQTNTSPEPLSEYQIYRNTERALDQVVLRNR